MGAQRVGRVKNGFSAGKKGYLPRTRLTIVLIVKDLILVGGGQNSSRYSNVLLRVGVRKSLKTSQPTQDFSSLVSGIGLRNLEKTKRYTHHKTFE